MKIDRRYVVVALLLAVGVRAHAGTISGLFPAPISFPAYANDMTVGTDGNLWIADPFNNKIGRLKADNTFTAFPVSGAGPENITSGPDGNLWFTAGGNVGRITLGGTITEFPVPGTSNLRFITSGADNALWFLDNNFGHTSIGRITVDGAPTVFTPPVSGFPSALIAGPDGNLWATIGGKINVISPLSGTVVATYTPIGTSTASFAGQMVVGPDGNVWLTWGNSIERVTASGVFTQYVVPFAKASPTAITMGNDGNVWFSDYGNGQVGQLIVSTATDSGQATINESNMFSTIDQPNKLLLFPTVTPPTSAEVPAHAALVGPGFVDCLGARLVTLETISITSGNLAVVKIPSPAQCADVLVSATGYSFRDRPLPVFKVYSFNAGPDTAIATTLTLTISPKPANLDCSAVHFVTPIGGGSGGDTTISLSTVTLNNGDVQLSTSPVDLLPERTLLSDRITIICATDRTAAFAAGAVAASAVTPDQEPWNNDVDFVYGSAVVKVLQPDPSQPVAPAPTSRGGH